MFFSPKWVKYIKENITNLIYSLPVFLTYMQVFTHSPEPF